jgi:hypothetical protein
MSSTDGILGRMWKAVALATLMIVTARQTHGQIPCPISLTSGYTDQDSIKLSFRNKGKLPIEQLSLSCTPPADHKVPNAICHAESGIFYPGTENWINLSYPGANRREIVISVKTVRAAGGVIWTSRSSDSCRALRVTRKK